MTWLLPSLMRQLCKQLSLSLTPWASSEYRPGHLARSAGPVTNQPFLSKFPALSISPCSFQGSPFQIQSVDLGVGGMFTAPLLCLMTKSTPTLNPVDSNPQHSPAISLSKDSEGCLINTDLWHSGPWGSSHSSPPASYEHETCFSCGSRESGSPKKSI